MKADRADYPDSKGVRVNVMLCLSLSTNQTIPHINNRLHCSITHCQYKMLHLVLLFVKW